LLPESAPTVKLRPLSPVFFSRSSCLVLILVPIFSSYSYGWKVRPRIISQLGRMDHAWAGGADSTFFSFHWSLSSFLCTFRYFFQALLLG
jgi:hypothetical protein